MSDVVIERCMAYGAVYVRQGEYAVVIAEKDVPGYVFDPAEPKFKTYVEADLRAVEKNKTIGLDKNQAWERVSSAMNASRALGKHWEPRGS